MTIVVKHTMNGDSCNGFYCYQCSFTSKDVGIAAIHDGMKIRTEYVFPPIANRSFDWSAINDNTYDGPGSTIGHGATEQAAIDDLMEQINS